MQVAPGDLAGALKSYRDDLAIADRLATSDPGNAGWQRDLSVSYKPATTGITVARDTRPVEITAPDLRAYALISYARGARDDVEMERSRFAAALVRERSPAQFDPRQEAAFPEV